MTTATATPSFRVTRSRTDTGPDTDWPASTVELSGWPPGRTAPTPRAPAPGRSALTVGLPPRG
jgi:hypothetical protein